MQPRKVHLLIIWMKLPRAIWLCCLLWLLGVHRSRAAIQFDVLPGYETAIHEAAWFPITCEIFNDGPSFNAIIELSGGQFGGEQLRQVPVELPTNTRKRIVVPMFAAGGSRYGGTENWTGKLLDTARKPIHGLDPRTTQTRVIPLESVIIGALPRNFGGSPVLPEMKNNRTDLRPEVARMTIDQFPDNPLTLEGLNVFYLSSEKAPELKVNQVTALLAWVRAGGHLIVSTEEIADFTGTPWLKQFVPVDLTDAHNVKPQQQVLAWIRGQPLEPAPPTRRARSQNTLTAPAGTGGYPDIPLDPAFNSAEMSAATGRIKDGKILFSVENTPLAVQAPRGRGQVTLLTFSPEREPFRSWKGRTYFWAKLASIPPEFFTNTDNTGWGGSSVDGIFGSLIDSRQIKKLPVGWLLLLLVVYLVVIGPFDQWWLKKINRQMLTWITFPTYVVLFSLLIYFIGYKLRAGETEWNELNIVDILPRGDQVDLHGQTYISIYSSGNATYSVTGQQGFAALRPELADFRGSPRTESLKIIEQGNSYKAEVFVPVWSSLLYTSEWFKTNDTPFIASLTQSGTGYQLEIENLLDHPLSNIRVVAGQNLFEIDPLPPNAKKLISLDPARGINVRQFVRENGAYFQQAVNRRREPLGEAAAGRLEDRPLTATTISLISYLEGQQPGRSFISPPGMDLSPLIERGDAAIFAWIPNFSLAEKMNDFHPPRFKQDTLLRLTVPIH